MKPVPEYIQRQRDAHHAALKALADSPRSGLQLWRSLHRLECKANAFLVAWCNGEVDYTEEEFDTKILAIERRVAAIFGGKLPPGFFVNTDPRGYALKIDPQNASAAVEGLHRDWGNYYILAATIDS